MYALEILATAHRSPCLQSHPMYSLSVRDKLVRRKPLLSENYSFCIGSRVKRNFIRRESPLAERDGYFTDENTDDNILKMHSTSLHRQLLRLIAPFFRLNALVDLETNLLPTALNMRSVFGEERFIGIPARLKIVDDAGDGRKMAAVKEGKWLICAIILYQALNYL